MTITGTLSVTTTTLEDFNRIVSTVNDTAGLDLTYSDESTFSVTIDVDMIS